MLCLIFGVASIATIGSLRGAIEAGLNSNGQVFLGGDAEIELTYRRASPQENDWMAQQSLQKSEIIDFRSMAVARDNSKRILTQVKAVDAAYPLVGEIVLSNGMGLPEALAGQNDLPGAVVAPALLRRLQLNLGDIMQLGEQEFVVMATLEKGTRQFWQLRPWPTQHRFGAGFGRFGPPVTGHNFFQ